MVYFGSDGKETACSAGDLSLIPGMGRSSGEGNGNPLQYSCLENSMDGGAWWATSSWDRRVGHGWAANTFTSHMCVCVCVTTNILGQKYWLLIPSSSRRNQDSLERWLILGQGKYKMSLDHVAVLEVKKVPLHTYTHTNSCNDGTMPRGTGASERPPNGQCWNINIMQWYKIKWH